MVVAKEWILAKVFKGAPLPENFRLVESTLPPLKDGEWLGEALFLSVDPYMRAFDLSKMVGQRMVGTSVARVLESRHPDIKPGQVWVGHFGWCSRFVHKGTDPIGIGLDDPGIAPQLLPDFRGQSPSFAVGALGMPGNTAYFGFLEICRPQPGETVVVNSAAGAVGSHVGQIAKIKGCRVVGICGSDDKAKWLRDELGFDATINYHTAADLGAELDKAAPKGVDCYFDNVGGEMSSTVMSRMNQGGRVSVCGAICGYNDDVKPKATMIQSYVNRSELKIEGFMVYRWEQRWLEGINQNLQWIEQGKLKVRETMTEGFEQMPKAFIEMMQGRNLGKAVVKA